MKFETRTVASAQAFDALRQLRADGYNVLVDLTAVDYSRYGAGPEPMGWEREFPAGACGIGSSAGAGRTDFLTAGAPEPKPHRFEAVYRLACVDPATGLETMPRLELRAPYDEGSVLLSVRSIWPNADWLEREVWDMFGLRFEDRPDIKRLLLYEEFVGHPLRKDYPLKQRQPLIGPESGALPDSPSFNSARQEIPFE
ncbi:MAG: NADH-quinone oxidoreductase subunit C [Elusimicrobia bacterium]|nr:NADH-quinone oxidoreductase subunit C [Elusimicrobiota bacterium]